MKRICEELKTKYALWERCHSEGFDNELESRLVVFVACLKSKNPPEQRSLPDHIRDDKAG
jgi:hypothetical protein